MATLSVANSSFYLGIGGLYPPTKLQGWGVDEAFTAEVQTIAEVQLSIDGRLYGGYVNAEAPLVLTLVAASPSAIIFDTWAAAEKAQQDVYTASGIITSPSLGFAWTLVNGFLRSYQPVPPGKKVFGSRQFGLVFENIIAAPI